MDERVGLIDRSDEDPATVAPGETNVPNPGFNQAIIASVLSGLLIVALFFIPYRIDRNDALVWAPFYRPPLTHATTFQELGTARVNYETGTVDFGILALQVVGILAAGWAASVVIAMASANEPGAAADDLNELQV